MFKNILLIISGSVLTGIGVKMMVVPHHLLTGGLDGVGLLIYYFFNRFSVGTLYALLNIPVFLAAWIFVGRSFFIYSLLGTIALSLSLHFINLPAITHDLFLTSLYGGAIIGAGLGIVLLSEGSTGGLDVLAVIVRNNTKLSLGTFFFIFNTLLLCASMKIVPLDSIGYSIFLNYVLSKTMDFTLLTGGKK